MSSSSPEGYEFFTKSRAIRAANGLTSIVFREILAFTCDGQLARNVSVIERDNIQPADLHPEPMPFDDPIRIERLAGVLKAIFQGSEIPLRATAAHIAGESVHANDAIGLKLRNPVQVNNLKEGILYSPVVSTSLVGGVPLVGTRNPTEGLYVQEDRITLVKAGDALHHHGAVYLAESFLDS